MSKYRALFIEESREHLAQLSRLMVETEGRDDAAVVDELFRHIHSVKGMAASMGYEAIATLSHRMEDVVDVRRKGARGVEPALVDLLLRGVDALSQQVEAVAGETALPEHAALVRELSEVARTGVVGPAGGGAASPGAAVAGSTAASAAAPGAAVASDVAAASPRGVKPSQGSKVVRVTIHSAASAPSVRAFMIYRKLAELGTLTDAAPSLEAIKRREVKELDLAFVIETTASDAEVRRAVEDISDVESVEVVSAPALESPLAAPAPTVTPKTAEPLREGRAVSTVRVRTDVLDNLIDSVGELFIVRERLKSLLEGSAHPEVRAALDMLDGRIREIQAQVMSVRMTRLGTITDRYPRLVRDLSRLLGKDVQLTVVGDAIELDRAILDNLDAPFVHTLRNAIDHGVEAPDVRRAAGKSPTGRITISSTRDRDSVLVVIEDDGRGLDAELLRVIAVKKGLLSEAQAQALSARDAWFLICLAGFSTKSEVSDVSGRGVGMDAVKSKIESLGGTLDIESELGAYTRFVFRLPLTLSIIHVLLVEAGGSIFAVPITKIVAVRETGDDTIDDMSGQRYLSYRHALAPVHVLADVLRLTPRRAAEQVVVVEDGRNFAALAVERIVGYHEVVVKPLGEPLDRCDWMSGATVLGDGQAVLILDLPKALRQGLAA